MQFMPQAEKKRLYSMQHVVSEAEKFAYIEPIKCRVKFRNLTKAGFLRIPSFLNGNNGTVKGWNLNGFILW
jgi:DNA ligase 1